MGKIYSVMEWIEENELFIVIQQLNHFSEETALIIF